MKIRWTALTIMAAVAALAVPQAASQFRPSGARAHAAALGELINAGYVAQHGGHAVEQHGRDHDTEFTERDEFRQTYQIAPGAPVRVSGINGRVDVETTSGSTAEVHVVRSARTRQDLEYRKIIVEQAGGGLTVRGEKENDSNRGERRAEVRQQVTLRVPRNINLAASGINGRTTVGEVDGPVKLSGINGRVEVGQARGYTDISGINGSVTMTIAQLGEQGIKVSGVNGRVELKFADTLNADLSVTGINGSVNTEGLPNVTIQGRVSRNNFNARIGSGGTPINVSGVNGSVRLAPRT
ncbi:MAG TPA: hypothetical protein VK421_12835 [Pyrinomonadaceae bacterium]|nr:hypothetical protein [Pyrinomonadaceae bacterium]